MNRQFLFVTAILASAFLIFLVQPLVGKRILPWFGGAPSVWMLCLAFYQTTLFLGYAYAHILIRTFSPFAQVGIHALVVALACLVLPVLPGDIWQPATGGDPTVEILAMLTSNVALPFLVLASTGPLVQAWFARTFADRSPYPLYAVSNLGSLAALFAYPFLFEPRLPLSTTGTVWSFAFVATALAVLACALISQRAAAASPVEAMSARAVGEIDLPASRVALWILLAGCAVMLLMGVTNSVCLDVASVPFLWVLPLATYLLSFIVCFASERAYRRTPYVALTLVSSPARASASDAMRGMGVSGGVATGPVRVLGDPRGHRIAPGEVLVAYTTDPGWTPLFVNAAAVILEVGGSLQHGAVVAREFGKPCVVGIDGVTTRLRDGERVEVDGDSGTVRLL